jgi:hypothetical protein
MRSFPALMRPHAVLTLLLACGTPGETVRPDEMSAEAHRQEAEREWRAAAESRRAAARYVPPPYPLRDPEVAQADGADPRTRLWTEANSRGVHARAHELAALELERFESRECRGIEPRARAACPVLGPATAIRDVPGGVRVELKSSVGVDSVVSSMRCHHAFAQTRGFTVEAAACPLYVRGIRIRRSIDGNAVEILGHTNDVVAEIRKHSRQQVVLTPEARTAR